MKKAGIEKRTLLMFLLAVLIFPGAIAQKKDTKVNSGQSYDIRTGLQPSRLSIAMWDYSWMYMHYPGGAFENFDKAINELKERGFNTVRIDAFPLIIGMLKDINEEVTIPGDSLRNWGNK